MMVFAGPRRQRRLAGSTAPLRQHLAALVGPPERLHGRQRREGLRLRRPVARPRGPAAVLDRRGAHGEDDDRHRHPGLHARRPVQRQPRVGDRARERDLARVRPLARPARLLLDRQPRDLRPVDADGHRLLAEHRRDRQEGARLARPARARAGPAGREQLADTKRDTGRIDWKRAGRHAVHAHRPGRPQRRGVRRDAARAGRSSTRRWCRPGTHLWWSGSGNDFGCSPDAGHNLDLALPAVPAGTQKLTLTFKSRWDIEWDYDYGFVLSSTDNGKTYTSYPSAKGYTTDGDARTRTPTAASRTYGNGLTGSSGSYAAGSQTVDRLAGQLPGGAVRRRRVRHLRPDRQAGRRAALHLRHRPGARAAGLVHRRRR